MNVASVAPDGSLRACTDLVIGDVQAVISDGTHVHVVALDAAGHIQTMLILVPDTVPGVFVNDTDPAPERAHSRTRLLVPRDVPEIHRRSPTIMVPDQLPPIFRSRTATCAIAALEAWAITVPDQLPPIYGVLGTTTLPSRPVVPTAIPAGKPSRTHVMHLPADSTLVFGANGRSTLLDPSWQRSLASSLPAGALPAMALGGTLVGGVRLDDERAVALWWTDPRTLEYVILRDCEVGSDEQVRGSGEFSPALIREALSNLVSQR